MKTQLPGCRNSWKLPCFSCAVAAGIIYTATVQFNAALATTLVVSTLAGSGTGSLPQVLSDALPGDSVTFSVNGTIKLVNGELTLDRDIAIIGPGPTLLAVNGNHSSRVFTVLNNVHVTISGITIQDGSSSNGVDGTLSSPQGMSGSDGGGILNSGTLILSNCYLTGNAAGKGGTGFGDVFESYLPNPGGAGGNGGAIYNTGTLTLQQCSFSNNTSGAGGVGSLGTSNPTCGFSGKRGGLGGPGGGGAAIYNTGDLTLIDCTVHGNRAGAGGAGGGGGDGSNGCPPPGFPNHWINGGDGGVGGQGGQGGDAGAVFNSGTLVATGCTFDADAAGLGGRGGGLGMAAEALTYLATPFTKRELAGVPLSAAKEEMAVTAGQSITLADLLLRIVP